MERREVKFPIAGHHLCPLLLLLFLCNLSTTTVHGALTVRLCGQKLVNIIKVLCNHKYVSPQAVYSPGYYSNQRQPRSGIVESCCWKQCTYNYLKSYCDDPETSTMLATSTSTSTTIPTTTMGIDERRRGELADESGDTRDNQQYAQTAATDDGSFPSSSSSFNHRTRQQLLANSLHPRRTSSIGDGASSDVWHDGEQTGGPAISSTSGAADTRRQVKTFRSLFHLLSYLSQFLSPNVATAVAAPSSSTATTADPRRSSESVSSTASSTRSSSMEDPS